jgi:hypothetical protein
VWKRIAKGRELHFYLAGINNQNFLMRDRETGSWWQQVTGRAISGPLAGNTLELQSNDELTFGVWKSESPHGLVLSPVAGHEKDYDEEWEKEVAKYPVPLMFPGQGLTGKALADRDVVLGISRGGQARAFPLARVRGANPIQDRVGGIPVVLVTGPDGESMRVFRSQSNGMDIELYRDADILTAERRNAPNHPWRLIDSQGNTWNFAGCATSGPAQGQCLEKINYLKDYWFDWKNYNPQTTVYSR